MYSFRWLCVGGYALFVVSVAYVVWQVLSSSVGSHQCVWQVYVVLAVEELVTALFFTASITVCVLLRSSGIIFKKLLILL